ncbi:hypothetical protein ES708_04848 [subsurface metagenome]
MQQMVAQPRTAQGERVVSAISLTVSDEGQADYVVEEITSLLRDRHRLGPGVDDDFNIMSVQEIAETISETTAHADPSSGCYSRHFTAGGGYRRDEHHAGVGAGEDQGDRHPQGAGSLRD